MVKNGSKMGQKWVKNGSKMGQKWIRNGSKIGQKSVRIDFEKIGKKNGPEMSHKLIQI